MRHLKDRGLTLAPVFALVAAALALGGCPAQGTCPSCRYRTASFSVSASDIDGLTSAKMHTHIENPSSECPKSGCVTDRTDDITCKIGTTAGKKTQVLPEMSADGATHTITVTLQKGSTTLPTITATVGSAASGGPSDPICP